jgi:cytochrome c-type biogenesis protein
VTREVAFALTAGVLAAFNPCGFSLLPGYLTLFIGMPAGSTGVVRRAVAVAGAVTVGFVAVFGVVGAAVSVLSVGLGSWLPVVTMAAGLLLLVVGLRALAGADVSTPLPHLRWRPDASPLGMVTYGAVYALVSLSCTLPVFLAAVVSVVAVPGGGAFTAVTAGVAYAVGMGLVMTVLALLAGLVGGSAVVALRPWARHVPRVGGAVVSLAALYVLWYGWVQMQAYNGTPVGPGPLVWVGDASSRLGQLVTDLGAAGTVTALVVVLAAAVGLTLVARGRSR